MIVVSSSASIGSSSSGWLLSPWLLSLSLQSLKVVPKGCHLLLEEKLLGWLLLLLRMLARLTCWRGCWCSQHI